MANHLNHRVQFNKLCQRFCRKNLFFERIFKIMLFPINFMLKREDMLHKHRQTCLSATDSRAVDYSPFLYHWFLKLVFSIGWKIQHLGHTCAWPPMFYINTIYKPAFCPFPLCTRNFGHIQQMAKCAT